MTVEEARAYLAETAPEERMGVLEVQAIRVLSCAYSPPPPPPRRPGVYNVEVSCAYCGRFGSLGSSCQGCGAPVAPRERSERHKIGPPVPINE